MTRGQENDPLIPIVAQALEDSGLLKSKAQELAPKVMANLNVAIDRPRNKFDPETWTGETAAVNHAFYQLTVAQRNHAWYEIEKLKEELSRRPDA